MSDELISLQTTIAFQEHALAELTDIITDQQKQLDMLRAQVRILQDKFSDLEGLVDHGSMAAAAEPEIPPHY